MTCIQLFGTLFKYKTSLPLSAMYTRLLDRSIYYVDDEPKDPVYDEKGWYVELSFSDGGYDVFGPYTSKEAAKSVF